MSKAIHRRFALAIHGGCGTLSKAQMTPALEAAYRAALHESLQAGHRCLQDGGSAIDAVSAAVVAMEDSPLFNAGHGSVFNAAGGHELDAAIMDGRSRLAGAIAAARRTRNPILVARAVMEKSDNVLLAGEGADAFAEEQGFAPVPQVYFATEMRRRALDEIRRLAQISPSAAAAASEAQKHGTVGAVALDQHGDLAAATSTGGFTNKALGRVGDTPIIGAGTYADNAACAVSATGKGEFFIRRVLAHEIAARLLYRGQDLATACRTLVLVELKAMGSSAGLVAVDRHGNLALPFNTEGMYRGWVQDDARPEVRIFED
ncbi:MAG TPA: isoaspartyl peptidase/L-asparaginase [Alphaproteobacteria bacterium]|nr:isoaspartyl peptidase/L-asparaginase [Alphaproteobacteria bacterium]